MYIHYCSSWLGLSGGGRTSLTLHYIADFSHFVVDFYSHCGILLFRGKLYLKILVGGGISSNIWSEISLTGL